MLLSQRSMRSSVTVESDSDEFNPENYATSLEMAKNEKVLLLFRPWLGAGQYYIDGSGRFQVSKGRKRAHSLTGLGGIKYTSCEINKFGYSGFTSFAQGWTKSRSSYLSRSRAERGGQWAKRNEVTPDEQTKLEGYCSLFQYLSLSFVELGYLEH